MEQAQAYSRHKSAVTLLLGLCLLLIIGGLTQADRLVIYTMPVAASAGDRHWLLVETRTGSLLDSEPRFEIYAGERGVRRVARLRGRPIALVPDGERLYVFLRDSFAIYDMEIDPLGYRRLPEEPAVSLLDAARLGSGIRLLGATREGLRVGRLTAGVASFAEPELATPVGQIRRARLLQVGARELAVWIEHRKGAEQSKLRCAELTDKGLVAGPERVLQGAALDLCGLGDRIYLSRRVGRQSRVEWLPFDGDAFGAEHRIRYQLPAVMRGPVLGLAAVRQQRGTRLYLARIGSLERIATEDPRRTDWGEATHIGGLTDRGRIAVASYFGLLCFTSLLLVAGGFTLFRRRPDRLPVAPPFRLVASHRPAPLWLRAAAYVADLLLLLPLVWLIAQRVLGTGPTEMLDLFGTQQLAFYLLWQSVLIPYFVVAEYYFQCSVGKALFGLVIVQPDGQEATFGALLMRNVSRVIDSAFLVGLLPMMITPLKQRFGDIWSDTMVMVAPLPEGEEEEEDIDW